MTCELAHLDGSYVLGALSPSERLDFERHLPGCESCSRSVRELAGLPGLLGRVDLDVVLGEAVEDPVPATLLPSLVDAVRRTQRRRGLVQVGLSVAATIVIGALVLVPTGLLSGSDPVPPATSPAAAGQPMRQVVTSPISADLAVKSVAWGTRLDLLCTYGVGAYAQEVSTYAMYVVTRDGRSERVATWRALPGKTLTLAAATAAEVGDIVAVEVRTIDGQAVLELDT